MVDVATQLPLPACVRARRIRLGDTLEHVNAVMGREPCYYGFTTPSGTHQRPDHVYPFLTRAVLVRYDRNDRVEDFVVVPRRDLRDPPY